MTIFLVRPNGEREAISRDEAVERLKVNYTENVCTYDELLESVKGYGCVLRVGAGVCLDVTE